MVLQRQEKEHWITHEYWGGYVRHNIICRKVYTPEGELIDDEYITENHAIMMYEPMLTERITENGRIVAQGTLAELIAAAGTLPEGRLEEAFFRLVGGGLP